MQGVVSPVITQRCYPRQTKLGLHSNTSEQVGGLVPIVEEENLEHGEGSEVEIEQS